MEGAAVHLPKRGGFKKRKKSYAKPRSTRLNLAEVLQFFEEMCPSGLYLNWASGHPKKSRQDRVFFAFFCPLCTNV